MLVKHFEGEKLRNVRSNPVSLLVPGNEQFFLSRWVQDVCSPCPPRSVSPTERVPRGVCPPPPSRHFSSATHGAGLRGFQVSQLTSGFADR